MVNPKRVEQKLPLLITDGPFGFEQDRNEYRLRQFRKKEPLIYKQRRDAVLTELEKLQRDLERMFNSGKK